MEVKIKDANGYVDAEWTIEDGIMLVYPKKEEKKGTIIDRVKSYEDACKELGRDPYDVKKLLELGLTKNNIAYQKMVVIVEALNEGWKPNWDDNSEIKFYPWFWMSPGSFAFGDSLCDRGIAYAGSGSRLKLKSRELAEYCATQFTDIWKDIQLG